MTVRARSDDFASFNRTRFVQHNGKPSHFDRAKFHLAEAQVIGLALLIRRYTDSPLRDARGYNVSEAGVRGSRHPSWHLHRLAALALVPAAVFGYFYIGSRSRVVLVTALLWLAYFPYELA